MMQMLSYPVNYVYSTLWSLGFVDAEIAMFPVSSNNPELYTGAQSWGQLT